MAIGGVSCFQGDPKIQGTNKNNQFITNMHASSAQLLSSKYIMTNEGRGYGEVVPTPKPEIMQRYSQLKRQLVYQQRSNSTKK
jgi:hypothetical protein